MWYVDSIFPFLTAVKSQSVLTSKDTVGINLSQTGKFLDLI